MATQLEIDLVRALLDDVPTNKTQDDAILAVRRAAERDRVVGVLDAFVSRHALIACHVVVFGTDGGQAMHMCEFRDSENRVLDWRGGDDPDSARAAAAVAIEAGEV